jgi:hypothetical protein
MACLVAPPWGKGNLRHSDVTGTLGLAGTIDPRKNA